MTPSAKAHGTMISGFPYPRVGSKLVELVSRCQIVNALIEMALDGFPSKSGFYEQVT